MNDEQEKYFALLEQAEQLQEAAMTQQKTVAVAVEGARIREKVAEDALIKAANTLEAASAKIGGPLVVDVSRRVSDAVVKEIAGEAKEQIQQLNEAIAKSRKDLKNIRENLWLALIGATVFALLVVTYGGWQAHRITNTERAELAEVRAEIADAEATLRKLEDKTWGVKLVKNEQNIRWIELPRGWTFGQIGSAGENRPAIIIIPK